MSAWLFDPNGVSPPQCGVTHYGVPCARPAELILAGCCNHCSDRDSGPICAPCYALIVGSRGSECTKCGSADTRWSEPVTL